MLCHRCFYLPPCRWQPESTIRMTEHPAKFFNHFLDSRHLRQRDFLHEELGVIEHVRLLGNGARRHTLLLENARKSTSTS